MGVSKCTLLVNGCHCMGGASDGAKNSEEKAENLKCSRHKSLLTIRKISTWIHIIIKGYKEALRNTYCFTLAMINLYYCFSTIAKNYDGIYNALLAMLIGYKE